MKARIGKWRFGLYIRHFFWKTTFVDGITSQCFDQKWNHVLFWDFETPVTFSSVSGVLRNLQRKLKLGTIHIFKSGERSSYRAVSTMKLPLKDMVTVLRYTPALDLAFLKWTMVRRCATIRVSPKATEAIHHIETLTSRMPCCYSLPHSVVLNKLWEIPIPENNDGLEKITWVKYETVMKEPQREIRNVQQTG